MATARDIKLTADGDWDVSSGGLELLSDADAIIQSCRLHLSFFKGEWFLDPNAGVPYWQNVLGKVRDPAVLQTVFRKALLEVKGVVSIQSLVLTQDRAARSLSVTFAVLSDVGLLAPVTVVI